MCKYTQEKSAFPGSDGAASSSPFSVPCAWRGGQRAVVALARHCSISLGDDGGEAVLSSCSGQFHPLHTGSEDRVEILEEGHHWKTRASHRSLRKASPSIGWLGPHSSQSTLCSALRCVFPFPLSGRACRDPSYIILWNSKCTRYLLVSPWCMFVSPCWSSWCRWELCFPVLMIYHPRGCSSRWHRGNKECLLSGQKAEGWSIPLFPSLFFIQVLSCNKDRCRIQWKQRKIWTWNGKHRNGEELGCEWAFMFWEKS